MNYQMYPNNQFYVQELQAMKDRIDSQMRQIQQQNQTQQQIPQPITQNFQIAPQQNNNELESKYVNNIDEVKNTFVMKTGLFINKDFNTLWVKDVTGKIRTFDLEETFEMDEKDKEIYLLKKQIEEMKGMVANVNTNESNNADINESIKNEKSSRVQNNKRTNAK